MQLGSFKSILGGFLSQFGFGTWPSEVTPPAPAPDFPLVSAEIPVLRRGVRAAYQTAWWKPIGLPVPPAVVPPTQAQWSLGGNPPRRARLPVDRGGFVAPIRVADVTAAVPALSWQAKFPDRVWKKEAPRTGSSVIAFTAALAGLDPSRFGWRGAYPDWIRRKAREVPGQTVLISPSIFPIPGTMSWQGRYADWVPAAGRLRANGSIILDPNPLPNAASPALAWKGYQPDQILAPRRAAVGVWTAWYPRLTPFSPDFVSGLMVVPAQTIRRPSPVPSMRTGMDPFQIVVPDIRADWQPRYLDQINRPRRIIPPASFWAAEGDRAVSPVDWYGGGTPRRPIVLPMRWPAEVLPPPPGSLILVGQQLAWRPDLPALIRFLAPPIAEPTMVIPPPLIAAGVGCVELSGGQVTTPMLLESVLTTPSLKDGVVTSPGLTEGDVC